MKIFGIFGYPLKHTLSPAMHNPAFQKLGIDAGYLPFELSPKTFKSVMKELGKTPLQGFNVTVPYKETVIPYLDRISPGAAAVGAVNTVKRRGKKFFGYNTDVDGFVRALSEAGLKPAGKKAVILGAGGAARACVAGFLREKAASIRLFNAAFDFERARKLKRHFLKRFPRAPLEIFVLNEKDLNRELEDSCVLVNATSVGMKKEDPVLIPARVLPKRKILAFDVIYNPAETAFLRLARLKGHKTANGLSMLFYQGVKAFEIWTGRKAPLEVMRKSLLNALEGNRK
ncbi:MAG TPA: shikimate dehydrogenase [Candidatus Omnitrophota bacterium]|nr:shikimate dehydrogenase [Candidatus Omnitrophota bacterium]